MQTYFKTLAPTLSPISLDTYIYHLLPPRRQTKLKRDKSESFTGDSTWIVRYPHLMKQTWFLIYKITGISKAIVCIITKATTFATSNESSLWSCGFVASSASVARVGSSSASSSTSSRLSPPPPPPLPPWRRRRPPPRFPPKSLPVAFLSLVVLNQQFNNDNYTRFQ